MRARARAFSHRRVDICLKVCACACTKACTRFRIIGLRRSQQAARNQAEVCLGGFWKNGSWEKASALTRCSRILSPSLLLMIGPRIARMRTSPCLKPCLTRLVHFKCDCFSRQVRITIWKVRQLIVWRCNEWHSTLIAYTPGVPTGSCFSVKVKP